MPKRGGAVDMKMLLYVVLVVVVVVVVVLVVKHIRNKETYKIRLFGTVKDSVVQMGKAVGNLGKKKVAPATR